ncbi:MAG TPA: FtsX-like permease family protein [Verrucomicrobiae bacterium]|nr:FtsX-like permease family protein [Verrucomicrobiae bacterium]
MYRLGLQLVLKSGREALVRLVLTTLAVAIGVTLLLGVLADYHAFQKTSARPSWESTTGTTVTSLPSTTPKAMLWNYSENIYKGQFIEQLNIAALGPNAPILLGIPKLPGPGQFYASPALAHLLQTVPKSELGDRFPGTQVGTIGEAALSFPTELAIFDGYTPNRLVRQQGTVEVTQIATAAQLQGTTNIYKEAFGIGALAVLFPLLILINTATRLSAARREERYAAMRLIGATPRQINIVASVDAIAGALFGAVLGSIIFLLARPAIANIALSGVKFFPNYVTPTIWGYVGMIVCVPIAAAIASLISLRRVQISPLGVSRKATPPKPGIWRLLPLVAGIVLFPYAASQVSKHTANGNGSPNLLFIGFVLIMVGIVLGGSWLTMQVTRMLARFARSAPALLAARRLSDNPKGAFRTVSGLVLAVFVGTVVSILVPAINQAQDPPGETSLSNVLRVDYNNSPLNTGLPPSDTTPLVRKMESYPGTIVIPLYTNPAFVIFQQQQFAQSSKGSGMLIRPVMNANVNPPDDSIASCVSLEQIRVLGSCPSGAQAVTFTPDSILSGDNPLFVYKDLPLVTHASPVSTANLSDLSLGGMLIEANNANTLEQIRTYLTVYNTTVQTGGGKDGNSLTAWQMGELEPETVGEVAEIRNNDDTNVGRAVLAVVALTLITAGCSLAVTVGGSLVERKRSFTLLRVSGVSRGTLYIVVLLEAALPLVVVSIAAAAIGLGVGIPVVKTLLTNFEPKDTTIPIHPSSGYYLALGVGLIVALGLVTVTLPLVSRMTRPEEARFE